MKKIVLASLLLSQLAVAGPLVTSADSIERLGNRISHLAERVESTNGSLGEKTRLADQVSALKFEVSRIENLLGLSSTPVSQIALNITAECHIDNDPNFNYGNRRQEVKGTSVSDIIQNCQHMAQAMYPNRNFSFRVRNLEAMGNIDPFLQSAECHIDNDRSFNFGHLNAGVIYGETLSSVVEDCKLLAEHTYPNRNSSSLKDINSGRDVPSSLASAECHIDNSQTFRRGRINAGVIFGATISNLINDCDALAQNFYPSRSSSRLRRINDEVDIPAGLVTAECRIDNSQVYRRGRINVGVFFGTSLSSIINDCSNLANSFYPSRNSTRVIKVNEGVAVPTGFASAECHMDNRQTFRRASAIERNLFAQSITALTRDCENLAKATYGERSSSVLRRIQQ